MRLFLCASYREGIQAAKSALGEGAVMVLPAGAARATAGAGETYDWYAFLRALTGSRPLCSRRLKWSPCSARHASAR